MSNRTFTIVKPDSVRKGNFGKIITRIEAAGFKVVGVKKLALSERQAQAFYAVHKERPVYVAALERESAVPELRKLMGATDPKKADAGTIRAEFGESIAQNAIHGSDSDDNAKNEIGFFFAESELV